MKNKITILSRSEAEKLICSEKLNNTAIISFYDPISKHTSADYAPVNFNSYCERVFGVEIPDIDIEILSDYGLTYDTYFYQADNLADFIINAVKDGCNIICQCEYGQSRSAACAAAIKEFYDKSGIEIFADYRYYPNQLVFNKLYASLKKRGVSSGTN